MSGHLQEDQLKKIEEVQKQKLLRIEQNAIHENLTKLQTWDLAEGQTLQERLQAHKESLIQSLPQLQENAAMQNAAAQQLGLANAAAAAPGAPVQEQVPAKQTYKQRREQARKAKVARKNCPVGTADTYDCVEATSRIVKERHNAMRGVPDGTDVDLRVLATFCEGYEVNKEGRPATFEDQAKANRDNAFLAAYLSKDVERRKPYLEDVRKELMDFPLTGDTVSDAYMVKNAEMLKRITDKSCYFENVMNDPINRPYFDSLPPADMELLKKKLDILAQLGGYYVNYMGGIGVSANSGKYYDHSMTRGITLFKETANLMQGVLAPVTAGWEQQKQEILERHVEQGAAAAKQEVLARIEVDLREQDEPLPEDMRFTSPAAGYATEELKRCRAMIEADPRVYAANKPLIDQLYQELYRGFDVFNELSVNSMAYQRVADERMESNGDQDPMFLVTLKKLEQIQKDQIAVRYQTSSISDALRFYFKEAPLSAPARTLLASMGKEKEAVFLEGKRAVRNVLEGEDGALARANDAYQKDHNLNAGLTALGARTSTSDYAKADKLLRGSTYLGYGDQMVALVHRLEDEDHVDMSSVMGQVTQQYRSGMGGGVAGGPIDAINRAMLRSFGDYLKGEDSIRYIQTLVSMLKGADMFGNNIDGALAYVVQSLFNSYGANYVCVGSKPESFAGGESTADVIKNVCRTLMSLSALERRGEAENEELPEATKELLGDYKQLLRDLKGQAFPPDAPQE